MKEKMKKYKGEIMIVIGSGLSSYNIFNFSYRVYGRGDLKLPGTEELEGIAYYYSSDALILISIGVMLVILGVLVTRKGK